MQELEERWLKKDRKLRTNLKGIAMNQYKFKNLNFFTIKFPLTAIVSILHRLSGIFIFLIIPFVLWILDVATGSPEGFSRIQSIMLNPILSFFIWLILISLWYHLFAGLRHILMDIGLGEDLTSSRISGMLVIVLTIIFAILTGIWLW